MGLTTAVLRDGLARIADGIGRHADDLNTLDGQLGDGDLGVTMNRASSGVRDVLDGLPDDLGQAFMACAQAVNKAASSSFGTLTATGLMAVAKATRGKTGIPWAEVPALIRQAREKMMERGRSNLGDKTVLDALEAAATAAEGLDDPASMLAAADAAASATLDAFRDKPNQIGRARIWAEKSVGLDDPGMVAFKRVLEVLRG